MMKAVIDCSIYESVAGSGIVKQARRTVEAPVVHVPLGSLPKLNLSRGHGYKGEEGNWSLMFTLIFRGMWHYVEDARDKVSALKIPRGIPCNGAEIQYLITTTEVENRYPLTFL